MPRDCFLHRPPVPVLPFLLPATSFPVQYKLSQGGQHNVLSLVTSLIVFFFTLKYQRGATERDQCGSIFATNGLAKQCDEGQQILIVLFLF